MEYKELLSLPLWGDVDIPRDHYYVYVYLDTQREEAIYVGKGSGERAVTHLNPVKRRQKAVSHLPFYRRLTKMLAAGNVPLVVIYTQSPVEGDIFIQESSLIQKLGQRTEGTGTLWNISRGGGQHLTDTIKGAMSESHVTYWANKAHTSCHYCGISTNHRAQYARHNESCPHKPSHVSTDGYGYLGKLWKSCSNMTEFDIRREFYGYTCNPTRSIENNIEMCDPSAPTIAKVNPPDTFCTTLRKEKFEEVTNYLEFGLESFDIFD